MIAEEFDYRLSLVEVAPFFRGRDYLVCFDSARESESIGRYSYLMASASLVVIGECDSAANATRCRTRLRGGVVGGGGSGAAQYVPLDCDPLAVCSLVLDESAEDAGDSALPPFRGGWAGYVGYDYGAFQLGVSAAEPVQPDISQLLLCWYDWTLAWDNRLQRAWIVVRDAQPDLASVVRAASALQSGTHARIERVATPAVRLLSEIRKLIAAAARGDEPAARGTDARAPKGARSREKPGVSTRDSVVSAVASNFSRTDYMRAVQSVRELILAGDIFQANISHRFTATYRGDAWQLYLRLRQENPASFAAFLEFQGAAILSASPEMFLCSDPDGAVETRPVKGTRPRGLTDAEDKRLADELRASEKDRSENLMIVDLLRNDLSRVCEPGSVFVPALFELEQLASVQHFVSVVRGKLRGGISVVDLFRACFPGGSITGAPKTRATQIIAAIERSGRGVYCGSIGYFAADGGSLFNIAIRTLTLAGGVATFSAGGGIVLDSDPAAEYDETIAKAAGIGRAIGGFP